MYLSQSQHCVGHLPLLEPQRLKLQLDGKSKRHGSPNLKHLDFGRFEQFHVTRFSGMLVAPLCFGYPLYVDIYLTQSIQKLCLRPDL